MFNNDSLGSAHLRVSLGRHRGTLFSETAGLRDSWRHLECPLRHNSPLVHRCLVKWLEVRCVCPMCNKPIAGPTETSQSIGILLDELV